MDYSLRTGETHVWLADLSGNAESLHRLSELLTTEERERASRFHFPEDRDRWARCRGILRTLLSRYLSVDPAKLALMVGKNGKPCLGAHPSLSFNLSHSGDKAMIGFCFERPIGVDIERLRSVPDACNMVESYFSEREKSIFREAPPEGRDEIFLSLWTQKEAYLKALGEGLAHPLDKDPDAAGGWVVQPIGSDAGYVAAAATLGTFGRILNYRWASSQLLE